MSDPHINQPDERVQGQLSDWTVRLALVTILVLGLVVFLSTGSPTSNGWDVVGQSAVQVSTASR